MSYTRFSSKRYYTKGTSNLYSWWDSEENKIAMVTAGSQCILFIDREDILEFVMRLLSLSGVRLSDDDVKKIAKELDVELQS